MLKKKFFLIIGFFLLIASFTGLLLAEEVFQDVPASVVVGEVFRLSLDKENIDFGSISGEFKVIGRDEPGGFYNQVSCQGNNGKPWVLKIQATQPPTFAGDNSGKTIPIENFKWKVIGKSGTGQVIRENEFNSFSLTPQVVYRSAGPDDTGNPVTLEFQYGLSVPALVPPAGRYQTSIIFTLTQEP